MNKLILIIAAVLCIILAACVGNSKVKNVDGNKVSSPVDTVALFDRINELNASIAGALATVCDTATLPIEYKELIFPAGKIRVLEVNSRLSWVSLWMESFLLIKLPKQVLKRRL